MRFYTNTIGAKYNFQPKSVVYPNHLGNIISTITDRKIQEDGSDINADGSVNFYTSQLVSTTDYYAFGQIINARTHSTSGQKYRYNFNGKEIDDEIIEGAQDFDAREYDNRLGRFFSVDPHQNAYPSLSPYSAFYNNPNLFIDKDGRDNIIYIVDFSSGKSALDLDQAAGDLQLAVDAIMGKDKVQVVILKPEQFDKTKLDPISDVVIVYGEISSIKDFVEDKYPDNDVRVNSFYNDIISKGNPENSDYRNNIAGVVPSRVENIKSAPKWHNHDDEWLKPGNSAQNALTMIFLHSVGHMTRNTKGHTNDEDGLFNRYDGQQSFFNKNFMLDATLILDIILKPNKERDRWDLKLNTFNDFTFASWNKLVFEKYFKQDFNKDKPINKMKGKIPSNNSPSKKSGNKSYEKTKNQVKTKSTKSKLKTKY